VKIRRDLLLFGLLAAAALAGGWWLLSQRSGGAVEAYKREAAAQARSGAAMPAPAEAFRATLCEAGRCVLVEAGGLAFLFGAGEGAGDGLRDWVCCALTWMSCCCPSLIWTRWQGCPGWRVRFARRDVPRR
jgi:hypothetical protein